MDRFRLPEMHEEPLVKCSQCSTTRYYYAMIYDNHSEQYFCGEHCFNEWVDEEIETVSDYYWRMNIE